MSASAADTTGAISTAVTIGGLVVGALSNVEPWQIFAYACSGVSAIIVAITGLVKLYDRFKRNRTLP